MTPNQQRFLSSFRALQFPLHPAVTEPPSAPAHLERRAQDGVDVRDLDIGVYERAVA